MAAVETPATATMTTPSTTPAITPSMRPSESDSAAWVSSRIATIGTITANTGRSAPRSRATHHESAAAISDAHCTRELSAGDRETGVHRAKPTRRRWHGFRRAWSFLLHQKVFKGAYANLDERSSLRERAPLGDGERDSGPSLQRS